MGSMSHLSQGNISKHNTTWNSPWYVQISISLYTRLTQKLQFIGVKVHLFDRMLYTRRKNIGSVSSSVSLRTPAFRAWSCLAKTQRLKLYHSLFLLTLIVRLFLISHIRSWKWVEGRFSSWCDTSGKAESATEGPGRQVGHFLMWYIGKSGGGETGSKSATQTSQRGWNSVVPNRFGIDVPWKAVWRG